MSGIRIKIKFPGFSRKKEIEAENIEFTSVKEYMENLRHEGDVSEYYGKLKSVYEELMKKLEKTKKIFEVLINEGEKKFSPTVKRRLEKIKKIKNFDVSSFQDFYNDTFYLIDKLMKIPPETQREVLKYEKGKEAVDSLNSFLKSLQKLKDILAKRFSEYSMVNHLENAFKKYEEMEEELRRFKELEKKIESMSKGKDEVEKLLQEKIKNLQDAKSKIEKKELTRIQIELSSLDERIKAINSYLISNLLNARRPISKILHLKDKKLFDFFQKHFLRNPLENINEDFWRTVNLLKEKNIELNEDESASLHKFLVFVDELEKKIKELKELEKKRKELENKIEKISTKNKEILRKFEEEKNDLEEEFKKMERRLNILKKEKNDLEAILKKNIRMLGIMLSKATERKINITPSF